MDARGGVKWLDPLITRYAMEGAPDWEAGWAGLPGAGEVWAGFGVVAEAGVDAGAELDEAPEEPDEIGKAVEIGDGFGRNDRKSGGGDVRVSYGLGEADGDSFCAAADGPGDLVGGGLSVGAGERPVGEDAVGGFDPVDEVGEVIDVIRCDGAGGLAAFGWGGEGGADAEEGALDVFGPGGDVGLSAEAAGEAEAGVELVDGAVSFDAEVGFRQAEAARETGGAGVSGFGGDG